MERLNQFIKESTDSGEISNGIVTYEWLEEKRLAGKLDDEIMGALLQRAEITISQLLQLKQLKPNTIMTTKTQNTDGAVSDHPQFTFGVAISFAKQGHKVARQGWNGKGMWIAYSPGSEALPAAAFWSTANKAYAESVGGSVKVLPCLTMKTATGEILMGWLASQTDMLADDWMVVE